MAFLTLLGWTSWSMLQKNVIGKLLIYSLLTTAHIAANLNLLTLRMSPLPQKCQNKQHLPLTHICLLSGCPLNWTLCDEAETSHTLLSSPGLFTHFHPLSTQIRGRINSPKRAVKIEGRLPLLKRITSEFVSITHAHNFSSFVWL